MQQEREKLQRQAAWTQDKLLLEKELNSCKDKVDGHMKDTVSDPWRLPALTCLCFVSSAGTTGGAGGRAQHCDAEAAVDGGGQGDAAERRRGQKQEGHNEDTSTSVL